MDRSSCGTLYCCLSSGVCSGFSEFASRGAQAGAPQERHTTRRDRNFNSELHMKSRRIVLDGLGVGVILLAGLTALGRSDALLAQDSKSGPATAEGTQLPKPAPPFRGKIGQTFKDSKQDFPQPLQRPGRSQCRCDSPRRRGLWPTIDLRRSDSDPAVRQTRQPRAQVHSISYDGHLLADPHRGRTQFHHVIDVVPTIYKAAGVPAPSHVDGFPQMPIAGVDMS